MITKVYVAGASKELDRAQRVIAELDKHDIHVVSTWPKVIGKVGSANPHDATQEQLVKWTMRDLAEVDEADVLALLLPAKGVETVGAYIELGWAAKAGKLIVGSGPHRPIFTPAMIEVYCETDDALCEAIIALHRARVSRHVNRRITELESCTAEDKQAREQWGT